MKYLHDPAKTKGSGVNSMATPGEIGLVAHLVLAVIVEGIILACEAQDVHVCDCVTDWGCGVDYDCPCFAVACPVDCMPVQ